MSRPVLWSAAVWRRYRGPRPGNAQALKVQWKPSIDWGKRVKPRWSASERAEPRSGNQWPGSTLRPRRGRWSRKKARVQHASGVVALQKAGRRVDFEWCQAWFSQQLLGYSMPGSAFRQPDRVERGGWKNSLRVVSMAGGSRNELATDVQGEWSRC